MRLRRTFLLASSGGAADPPSPENNLRKLRWICTIAVRITRIQGDSEEAVGREPEPGWHYPPRRIGARLQGLWVRRQPRTHVLHPCNLRLFLHFRRNLPPDLGQYTHKRLQMISHRGMQHGQKNRRKSNYEQFKHWSEKFDSPVAFTVRFSSQEENHLLYEDYDSMARWFERPLIDSSRYPHPVGSRLFYAFSIGASRRWNAAGQ